MEPESFNLECLISNPNQMNLESPKVNVQKSAQNLFELLSDVKNFEQLMPENIAKFEVIDENCFEFGLKGMPEIKLVKKGGTPNSQIVLGAASSKLPFTLTANLTEVNTAVLEPVPSCVVIRINDLPAVAVGIVNVQAVDAVRVAVCTVPLVKAMVFVVVTVPIATTASV